MTTQEKIENILQITPNQYLRRVIDRYVAWTNLHNQANDSYSQRLLTSPALFNWWFSEYRKLELVFLEMTEPYTGTISKKEAERLYLFEVIKINMAYSKALIYCAKHKSQNINPILN